MKTYKTKDFYLASLFICKGFEFIGSEKPEHSVFFKFEYDNEEKLHKIIDEFLNFEAMVNMQKFKRAQVTLRRELDKYRK